MQLTSKRNSISGVGGRLQLVCFLTLVLVENSRAVHRGPYLRSFPTNSGNDAPCYDEDRPRRCMPDFVNAAFGVPIEASSTCGHGKPARFCDLKEVSDGSMSSGLSSTESTCDICDETDAAKRYSSVALTDVHNSNNVTCWRSEPRIGSVDAGPDNVTLTLSLGKKFELTYVSIMFCPHAIRPDSMAIYKSADYGKNWLPFQFYSSQCRKLYGRPTKATISPSNEQEARCVDHNRYSVDGVQGSRIAFSTLEGRPSASDFDNSVILQDWVTATDIRVIFHRLQSFNVGITGILPSSGGGVGSSMPKAQSAEQLTNGKISGLSTRKATDIQHSIDYSLAVSSGVFTYALSDFAVGGRCKCNGHASRCIKAADGMLECDCKHNTAGRDCERCKPFFFDRPWGRGTMRDANECKDADIPIDLSDEDGMGKSQTII
ncbi:netrin-A-like [Anopheles nili]|uniref:netrin-A-like n=1 Tax=Anopheles nili TaxID=185578 RepID=UPI00237AE4EA|nr:netrin-A-like [Anopheles nili]